MITNNNNLEKKVYLITGASKGFGLEMTNQLLRDGYNVAATTRDKDVLISNVDKSLVTEHNFLPLKVDITSNESVREAVKQVLDKFTRIDVLINNAGYLTLGSVEELSDEEIRNNYEVNLFGTINLIKNTVPYLRENKTFSDGPRIINISSIGGFTGQYPGFSIYCSTKFALDGLTEGLAEDLKEFGIHVTSVKPSMFKTNFLKSGSMVLPETPIPEYTAVRGIINAHTSFVDGNQAGDPVKGAAAIIKISQMPTPPVHIFLGNDALEYANEKITTIQEALKSNLDITTTTEFVNY